MSYSFIDTTQLHWRWKEFGTGTGIMLAFHGFNRGPDDFQPFAAAMGNRYKILAFELFFHGKSFVKGDGDAVYFERHHLAEAIALVLERYSVNSFAVMAYSFGGRIALNLVEIMPERIEKLYLMAPDALRFNPGYRFAAQTVAGRYMMKKYHENPAVVLGLMHMLAALGFYNTRAMEFYMNHIRNRVVRDMVRKVWLAHRKTVPDYRVAARTIGKLSIPVWLFFGEHDVIIPPALGKRFVRYAGPSARLYILETGHRVNEKHEEIGRILREPGESRH